MDSTQSSQTVGKTLPPLRAYQTEGVDFVLNRLFVTGEGGAGLAASPGAGKTRITLSALETLFSINEVHRVLLVGPIRVLQMVWRQEAEKWGIPLRIEPFTRSSLKSRRLNQPHIETISRDSLHHAVEHAGRWDLVVIDESHGFKQWKSSGKRGRMKSLRQLLPRTPKRINLTGTPTPNSLADMYSQTFILDNGEALGRNVTVFRKRFMERGGWQGKGWKIRNDVMDDLLEIIAPLWLRIDAEAVLDMPELIVNDIRFPLPQSAKKIHADLKRKLAAELESGSNILANSSGGAYAKLRQVANGRVYDEFKNVHFVHNEKIKALKELVDALGGAPLLLYYQFNHDATAIQEEFKDLVLLNGGLKQKDAERRISRWMDGKVQILLAQQQGASEGLNFQGECGDIGFFGISDIAALYEQGFRRVHRPGAKKKFTRIHRFIAEGTVEEIQLERVDGKLKGQNEFLMALKEWVRG